MNAVDENWIVQFMDQAENHEQWLAMVEFGKTTLLNNQALLLELIFREAERIAKKTPNHVTADEVVSIFAQLNLFVRVGI